MKTSREIKFITSIDINAKYGDEQLNVSFVVMLFVDVCLQFFFNFRRQCKIRDTLKRGVRCLRFMLQFQSAQCFL